MTDGSDPNADHPWARLKPVLPETNQSHDEPVDPDPGALPPEGPDNPEESASSGTRWLRPARDVLCPAVEDLQSHYDTYRALGIKGFMAQYLHDPHVSEYINDEVFYDYDPTTWTVDGPQPQSLMMLSVGRYIQY